TIDGALTLYDSLIHAPAFDTGLDNIKIRVYPLVIPDLNILNYVFNFVGNKILKKMNQLTELFAREIIGQTPKAHKGLLEKTYLVSDTELFQEEYGDSVVPFLNKIGIPRKEWDKTKKLFVVRSVIMSPYLTTDYVAKNYAQDFIEFLKTQSEKNKEKIINIWKS
ncbi:MAG: hypothetical protein N3B16_09745, partial [Candidatus Aminicenantes bacterium]|nr:hypothetical protein [Candidatus Aminicenantes bacterium]